jgi:hypothetical protein
MAFGVYFSGDTRLRTQLHLTERVFEFPYVAVSQEEAWLLDAFGYTTDTSRASDSGFPAGFVPGVGLPGSPQ